MLRPMRDRRPLHPHPKSPRQLFRHIQGHSNLSPFDNSNMFALFCPSAILRHSLSSNMKSTYRPPLPKVVFQNHSQPSLVLSSDSPSYRSLLYVAYFPIFSVAPSTTLLVLGLMSTIASPPISPL